LAQCIWKFLRLMYLGEYYLKNQETRLENE
jgi:hypothetical protein